MRTFLIFILFLWGAVATFGQKGQLAGKVTDAQTGEELVGAAIVIEGTTTGTITDFSGNFVLPNIAPGTYTFRCQFISYEPQIASNISIKSGATTQLDIQLKTVGLDLQEVKVVAKANRESESMLLVEQKNAVVAVQSIGAQELSRKGVSDAQGAVTKVSGISKQDGVKNVFVRGLGDRYNASSLNGFPVPSEDPEYKNVSLDFFSSDMIQSVGVNKVFNAGLSGDVGGADINISSKILTKEHDLGFDLSVGANNHTVTHDFKSPSGVNKLGFVTGGPGPTDLTKYTFDNTLDPSTQNFQLNNEYAVSGGQKVLVGEGNNPLSFYLIGSYAADYAFTNGVVRNTTTTGTIFQDMTFEKSKQDVSHMVLANIDYRFKGNELSYNGLVIHANTQSVGDFIGKNSVFEDGVDYQGFLRRQQVNDNSLIVNQLLYSGKVGERVSYHVGSSLNLVTGNEPDRRMNYLSDYGNGLYHPTKGTGRQQRYFSELGETDLNVKMGASYKLSNDEKSKSAISLGYSGRFVDRTFEAIEYDQQVVNMPDMSVDNLLLDGFFNQTNLTANDFKLDRNRDEYTVGKYVNSGYGELVCQLRPNLVGVVGTRVEAVDMNVDYNVNRGGTTGQTNINDLFVLPSLNLKYDVSDKQSLRLGISRTYTLPQAKEISPFRYVDVSFKSQGNSKIKSSTNNNIDLKWDYYLSSDELVSVTGFYKLVQNPISRVEKASAGGFLTYDNIADNSTIEGVELELRKNIFKTTHDASENGHKLAVGVNASYILTDVKLEDKNFTNSSSQLEGAAPFIVNADLSFMRTKADFSFTSSLVLNYFSDRIYTIGTQGYEDIVEKGVPTLDFVNSLKVNKHWSASIKIKNILDPSYQLSRKPVSASSGPVILNDYKKGVSASLGISYNL